MVGQTLGHYKIVEKLGAGGMGEVYRAEDTVLGRDVALKVLPEAFTADAERLARFEREAKLLATLDHPNIAAIHSFEQDRGVHFLVMQLAEGETLADRIARGRILLDEALPTVGQIAQALEAAHQKGIIHRDLKPGNIKVDAENHVRVLDFGLAKALHAAGPDDEQIRSAVPLSESPTLTAEMTGPGVLLGTAAYMSPEQARGKPVDKRVDIWAFGCVLYEMLSGRQAFAGDTVTDYLAKILEREPDWDALPKETPQSIRTLLRRCLTKDPARRLHDMGDVRIEIEDALGEPSGGLDLTPSAMPRGGLSAWPYLIAFIVVAVLATGLLVEWLSDEEQLPVRSFLVADSSLFEGPLALLENNLRASVSPDGSKVVFHAENRLWLRDMDSVEPRPLDGTEGGALPFWSTDSSSIAYLVGPELRRLSLDTGIDTLITAFREDYTFFGGTWGAGNRIVLATVRHGLFEVSAQGGESTSLLAPNREQNEHDFHYPIFLADGRTLAFVVHTADYSIRSVVIWDGDEPREVFEGGPLSDVRRLSYDPSSGYLLVGVVRVNPGIWAVRLDTNTFEPVGEPELVVPHGIGPSVGDDGTLLYIDGVQHEPSVMMKVSRAGQIEGVVGKPLWDMRSPVVSADGARVAARARVENPGDVWVQEINRDSATRITSDNLGWYPVAWVDDGASLLLRRHIDAGLETGLFRRRADGTGTNECVLEGAVWDASLSAEDRVMVYETAGDGGVDLWITTLEDPASGEPLVATSARERSPALSPDGSLLAYTSDVSGEEEVYLQPLPEGDRMQVSSRGGIHPRWSPSGAELYYLEEDTLLAVPLTREGSLGVGAPTPVFTGKQVSSPLDYFGSRLFDVTPDGNFIVIRGLTQGEPRLVVVQNWHAKLMEEAP